MAYNVPACHKVTLRNKQPQRGPDPLLGPVLRWVVPRWVAGLVASLLRVGSLSSPHAYLASASVMGRSGDFLPGGVPWELAGGAQGGGGGVSDGLGGGGRIGDQVHGGTVQGCVGGVGGQPQHPASGGA
jgi:hypothetical protein